jgi:plastocyanin
MVGEGFLLRLCGCAEASGTFSTPAVDLDCTVASGTQVAFHYLGTQIKHQLVPNGGASSFFPSAVSDPELESPIRVHVVTFSSSGTYSYMDAFNQSMVGRIIVP